jgi:hypothetical protein
MSSLDANQLATVTGGAHWPMKIIGWSKGRPILGPSNAPVLIDLGRRLLGAG